MIAQIKDKEFINVPIGAGQSLRLKAKALAGFLLRDKVPSHDLLPTQRAYGLPHPPLPRLGHEVRKPVMRGEVGTRLRELIREICGVHEVTIMNAPARRRPTEGQAIVTVESEEEAVYVSRTGSKYHRSSCQYLRRSRILICLKEAKQSY